MNTFQMINKIYNVKKKKYHILVGQKFLFKERLSYMTEIKSGLFNRPVTFRGKYKGSSTDDTVDFDEVCAQMECRVSIR